MSQSNQPTSGRQFGYVVAIIVNVVMIYVFNNLLSWHLPYISQVLAPAFTNCLWAINLSLSVTIFMNFIFLVFDPHWFHRMMEAIQNVFALVSMYVFYSIFPLELPSPIIAQIVHWALLLAMFAIVIAIVVEVLQSIRYFARSEL